MTWKKLSGLPDKSHQQTKLTFPKRKISSGARRAIKLNNATVEQHSPKNSRKSESRIFLISSQAVLKVSRF